MPTSEAFSKRDQGALVSLSVLLIGLFLLLDPAQTSENPTALVILGITFLISGGGVYLLIAEGEKFTPLTILKCTGFWTLFCVLVASVLLLAALALPVIFGPLS